jgi:alkylated DNA repair dioxygenase AlkB
MKVLLRLYPPGRRERCADELEVLPEGHRLTPRDVLELTGSEGHEWTTSPRREPRPPPRVA